MLVRRTYSTSAYAGEKQLTGVLMLVRRTYWSAYAGEKSLLECLCW